MTQTKKIYQQQQPFSPKKIIPINSPFSKYQHTFGVEVSHTQQSQEMVQFPPITPASKDPASQQIFDSLHIKKNANQMRIKFQHDTAKGTSNMIKSMENFSIRDEGLIAAIVESNARAAKV